MLQTCESRTQLRVPTEPGTKLTNVSPFSERGTKLTNVSATGSGKTIFRRLDALPDSGPILNENDVFTFGMLDPEMIFENHLDDT